jgi:hypothetical protein
LFAFSIFYAIFLWWIILSSCVNLISNIKKVLEGDKMADTNAPGDDLEKRMEEIANQGVLRTEAQSPVGPAQTNYVPPSVAEQEKRENKGWDWRKKTALGGGLTLVGLVGGTFYVVNKVWTFVNTAQPRKLVRTGASIGILYFMLNPFSCSRQIMKGIADYFVEPGKKIFYGQGKIKELQKEKEAAEQKIKDLITVKKQAGPLEQQVLSAYALNQQQEPAQQYAPQSKKSAVMPLVQSNPVVLVMEPTYFVHEKGQTLASIAREVTGDASNWKEIARYNELRDGGGGRSVNTIFLGQRLMIPGHLVWNASSVSYLAEKEDAGWYDYDCVPAKHATRLPDESFEDAVAKVTGNPGDAGPVVNYNRQLMKDFDSDFEEFYVPKELVRNQVALSSK